MNINTEINTEQKIKAMNDSVYVINKFCDQNLDDTGKQRLDANVKHLSYMLTRREIIDYTGDKSVYTNAISKGNAKLT